MIYQLGLKIVEAVVKDQICRFIFLNLTVDEEKVTQYQAKKPFATLLKQRHVVSSRAEATSVEPPQTLATIILSYWQHGTATKELLSIQGQQSNTGITDRGIIYQY